MLYLTAFHRRAKAWVCQDVRIGFDKESNEFNEGFKPEWHHVFPRKIVKDSTDADCIANIVVLNEKANRSFSAKHPLDYLQEHNVSREGLDEQAIPSDEFLELSKFEEFLRLRAQELAARATAYLQELAK